MQSSIINQYEIGNTVLLSVTWTDGAAGTPYDPVSVTLRVLMPGSTPTVYVYGSGSTISKDSIGNYSAKIPLTISGIVNYRWDAGGTYPAAIESMIKALPSNIISG